MAETTVTILRGDEKAVYTVVSEGATLLEMLETIKTTQDPTLTFTSGCRSGVCGSCAVRADGTEVLACACKPEGAVVVEPLRNVPVLRDLAVDMEGALARNVQVEAWNEPLSETPALTIEDERANALQSDCILCGACYSACPVYAYDEGFAGPFALTRSWRYVSDKRTANVREKLEAVQTEGIWNCTLCNECVPVCPQGIAPKQDIVMLRTRSGTEGFADPNLGGFGGLDFGAPSF